MHLNECVKFPSGHNSFTKTEYINLDYKQRVSRLVIPACAVTRPEEWSDGTPGGGTLSQLMRLTPAWHLSMTWPAHEKCTHDLTCPWDLYPWPDAPMRSKSMTWCVEIFLLSYTNNSRSLTRSSRVWETGHTLKAPRDSDYILTCPRDSDHELTYRRDSAWDLTCLRSSGRFLKCKRDSENDPTCFRD